MLRRRALRLATSLLVVCSLLFAQLALAAYACPVEQDLAAMADHMAAGMPCEDMDPQQPALCHEHATTAAQSPETSKLPVPGMAAVVLVLAMPVVVDVHQAVAVPSASEHGGRPPPDPLYLATRRLRV